MLPFTPFDNKLDRKSINPRYQAFEKFISGMYLGEITRNVLLNLIDTCPPVLFDGYSTPQFNKHYGFDTAIMSEIESAETAEDIRQALFNNFNLEEGQITDEDTETVRWACKLVARRAARLSAAAVAAVLVQTDHAKIGGGGEGECASGENEETMVIGVDGRRVLPFENPI